MLDGKQRTRFKSWLIQQGGEVLPVTNEHEAIRFKGRQTGVLYKSGKVSNEYAREAILAFCQNKKWKGSPIKMKRKNYKRQKSFLLERDGDCCFFCGNELGDDITVEHLISLSSGGKNTLSNMVLAHEACNQQVSNKPIFEKVQIAINQRTKC